MKSSPETPKTKGCEYKPGSFERTIDRPGFSVYIREVPLNEMLEDYWETSGFQHVYFTFDGEKCCKTWAHITMWKQESSGRWIGQWAYVHDKEQLQSIRHETAWVLGNHPIDSSMYPGTTRDVCDFWNRKLSSNDLLQQIGLSKKAGGCYTRTSMTQTTNGWWEYQTDDHLSVLLAIDWAISGKQIHILDWEMNYIMNKPELKKKASSYGLFEIMKNHGSKMLEDVNKTTITQDHMKELIRIRDQLDKIIEAAAPFIDGIDHIWVLS